MIPVSKIRTDGGTQSRAAINEATVDEYAEALADPETVFPPVVVYYDGRDHWLADGFHRVAAWERVGRVEVPAEVRQGDRRRAILHSVAANSTHGLRRTNDDKRRAVMTLLEDDEWSKWSDRQIARQCGVSHEFVRKLRGPSLSTVDSEPRTYTTKHGTEATMNVANIGQSSNPDQEQVTSPAPQERKADEPVDRAPVTTETAIDQEPEPVDPHRAGLSGLTREGLEDEVAGLRAENAELREKLAKVEAERDRFKAANKDLSQGDQGATISRLQKQMQAMKYARDEAMSATKREEYKRKKAEAEVKRMTGQEVEI